MVALNLFPWRPYARAYERKRFIETCAISLCLAILLNMFIHLFLIKQRNEAAKRMTHLQQLVQAGQTTMPPETVNIDVTSFMQEVHHEQIAMQQQLQIFSQNLAPDLCLTEINYLDHQWKMTGIAHSLVSINSTINQWNKRKGFSKIALQQLQMQNQGVLQFHVYAQKDE